MDKFDWNNIHEKCDLNAIRDNIWHHSRFFGLRFTNIIKMIEDEYYFESLMLLIILLEQYISSMTHSTNARFEDIVNSFYKDSRQKTANDLRNLRNHLAHRYLFKYYISFDKIEEYPLSELSNYEYILSRLFLPIMGCFDNQYETSIDFMIGEYTIEELASQYCFEDELDKVINLNVSYEMSKEEVFRIQKKNELEFMRRIDSSAPVSMWLGVLKELFK